MVVCSASRRHSRQTTSLRPCVHTRLSGDPSLALKAGGASAGTIARAYKLTSPECQGMTMLICADAAMVVDVTDRMA